MDTKFVHFTDMRTYAALGRFEQQDLSLTQATARLVGMLAVEDTSVIGPNPFHIYKNGHEIGVLHILDTNQYSETLFYKTYRLMHALLYSYRDHESARRCCSDLVEQYFGLTNLQLPNREIQSNREAAAYTTAFLLGLDILPELPSVDIETTLAETLGADLQRLHTHNTFQ